MPNINSNNATETVKTEHPIEMISKTEGTSANTKISDLKAKKQMKELRRLHENIVKGMEKIIY